MDLIGELIHWVFFGRGWGVHCNIAVKALRVMTIGPEGVALVKSSLVFVLEY